MRNIVVYPIKAEESIAALQVALESYSKSAREHALIGGVDGLALLMAEKFIEANKERFNTFSAASLDVLFEKKE
jgi:hypothetical protein